MDQELKAKWVAALRSGDYKQGDGVLRERTSGGSYCCLGVLCEIDPDVTLDEVTGCYHYTKCQSREDNYGMVTALSSRYREDLDMRDASTSIPPRKLVQMNDCDHNTFDEIADYIEGNIL